MTILKMNSYKGKQLANTAQNWEGTYLYQVYDKWSDAKQKAWDYCYDLCLKENGEQFSIVSHNTFTFSVSWFTELGIRMETANNSYLILWEKED